VFLGPHAKNKQKTFFLYSLAFDLDCVIDIYAFVKSFHFHCIIPFIIIIIKPISIFQFILFENLHGVWVGRLSLATHPGGEFSKLS